MAHPSRWLRPLPQGLWCEPGGFFIDPTRAVDRAVVTHAHSDHARPGHGAVLATPATIALMRARLGAEACRSCQPLPTGTPLHVGDVELVLQPAGHVLGSAQVVITHDNCRVVISGDYKRAADPTCDAFVPVPCDLFVTEATFALPVFRHPPATAEIGRLLASVALFGERTHVVGCYSLGKCQRLIALLRAAGWDRPIFLHGALVPLWFLAEAGWAGPTVVLGLNHPGEGGLTTLGAAIAATAQALPRRLAVVASGDMSHRLTVNAPCGHHPQAHEFDETFIRLVCAGDYRGIEKIAPELRELPALWFGTPSIPSKQVWIEVTQ